MTESKNLISLFNESKYYSLKYKNYFPVYEKLFSRFKNKKVTFVEIGVFSGGSLFMWKNFFGKDSRIIGIDLNPDAKQFEKYGFEIFIGNQSSKIFWKNFFDKVGNIDILLDDGGHTNYQQIITCCSCTPHINDDGILAVEDVYHSYVKKNFFNPSKYSFINFCKKIIDDINYRFPNFPEFKYSLNHHVYSVEFFESFVAMNINKELCKIKNEVLYNKGFNILSKDLTHVHNDNIPGSNSLILKLKRIHKSFRGNFKYLVFIINVFILKKYFK
jgi:hypothetical protein